MKSNHLGDCSVTRHHFKCCEAKEEAISLFGQYRALTQSCCISRLLVPSLWSLMKVSSLTPQQNE